MVERNHAKTGGFSAFPLSRSPRWQEPLVGKFIHDRPVARGDRIGIAIDERLEHPVRHLCRMGVPLRAVGRWRRASAECRQVVYVGGVSNGSEWILG